MDAEMAEMNRKYIPNMKIKYICNAGHWPHIDTPNEVNCAIHEFLNMAD
jgi:pimeloyl-ACP methyl ester carboxylesterase